MKYSGKDLQFLQLLRSCRILDDVDEHLLDESLGTVMVSCSDGRRMHDIFTHKVKMQRFHRPDPKIHTIAVAGGAPRLVKDSPMNEPGHTTDVDLMREIRLGCQLMETNIVALYAHGACGMATMSNMNLLRVFDDLVAAKERVKLELPGSQVACFYHAAYPIEVSKRKRFWFGDWVPPVFRKPLFGTGERQRTYFLSRDRFEGMRELLLDEVGEQEGERIVLAA